MSNKGIGKGYARYNWKIHHTTEWLRVIEKEEPSEERVIDEIHRYWFNTRNRGKAGLRLTDEGLRLAHQVGLPMEQISYAKDIVLTPQVVLFLDKHLDCPFYLDKNAIVVTDEMRAVELIMYSGDIKRYGEVKAGHLLKKRRAVAEYMKNVTCIRFFRTKQRVHILKWLKEKPDHQALIKQGLADPDD